MAVKATAAPTRAKIETFQDFLKMLQTTEDLRTDIMDVPMDLVSVVGFKMGLKTIATLSNENTRYFVSEHWIQAIEALEWLIEKGGGVCQ